VLNYDELLKVFDSRLVKLQFQVAVTSLGYEADKYFTKYLGRFVSFHLVERSPAKKEQVPVGQGSIDMKRLVAAAKTGGSTDYFLEMPLDLRKPNVPYLKELKAWKEKASASAALKSLSRPFRTHDPTLRGSWGPEGSRLLS